MIILVDNLNKFKFITILILDVLFNSIPIISIIIIMLYFINKLVFKKIIRNNMNMFIFSIIYMFIFISYIYLINDYNYSYLYYFKSNILSIILNVIIYYLYIFYK